MIFDCTKLILIFYIKDIEQDDDAVKLSRVIIIIAIKNPWNPISYCGVSIKVYDRPVVCVVCDGGQVRHFFLRNLFVL